MFFSREAVNAKKEKAQQKALSDLKSTQSTVSIEITQKSRRKSSSDMQEVLYSESYDVKSQPDHLLYYAPFRIFGSYQSILSHIENNHDFKVTDAFDSDKFEWRYYFSIDNLYNTDGFGSSGPLESPVSLLNSFNLFRDSFLQNLDSYALGNYLITDSEDRKDIRNRMSNNRFKIIEKIPENMNKYVRTGLTPQNMEDYFKMMGPTLIKDYFKK